MSFEEEFDRIMREKAEGLEYPFNEAHWQKASRLIRESRASMLQKLRPVFWVAGMVTVAALSTVLIRESDEGVLARAYDVKQSAVTQSRLGSEREEYSNTRNSIPHSESEALHENARPDAVSRMAERSEPTLTRASSAVHRNQETSSRIHRNQETSPHTPAGPELAVNPSSAGVSSESTIDDAAIAASTEQAMVMELPEWLPARTMMLQSAVLGGEVNSEIRAIPARDEDYYKKNHRTRFYAGLSGGGAYNLGWERSGSTDGKGLNWYGGVNAGFVISRHLSISTGIQAFNLSHIQKPFHVAKSQHYDFTSTQTRTLMTCSQLQFLGVPLRFNYQFGSGDLLSAGVVGAQLWRADNRIVSTTTRDNTVINETTASNHNLYEGMTQQQLFLSVIYKLKVGTRLFVDAEMLYGTGDLYSGVTSYGSNREIPKMFRVGLTYRLLEK